MMQKIENIAEKQSEMERRASVKSKRRQVISKDDIHLYTPLPRRPDKLQS